MQNRGPSPPGMLRDPCGGSGRQKVVILNEVKDLAPNAVQIQSRDPSGEKHAVRMTGQR